MSGWREKIRKVVPYVPGEQPKEKKMIKLNTNENPYPPSPKVEEVLKGMNTDALRLYPDPTADVLVTAIAERYQVSKDQVFVGVGSDDVLAIAFMTCFQSEQPILFPDITYSFYDVWADLFRIPYEKIPLKEDFTINPEDYDGSKRISGGIIFPNPNAPTGIAMGLSDIEWILEHNREVVVIVDEAYVDFGAESSLPLLEKYDNLLVVQTFSKSRSLAGMRIGFALGNPELIRYMQDVKYSFNSYTLNQTALVAGAAALKDEDYFRKNLQRVITSREWTKEQLRKLGFSYLDSSTNFIFATHPEYPAAQIYEALRREQIYVRYFPHPRIDNFLRISIGTQEEMESLVSFLKQYIKEAVPIQSDHNK